MKNKKTEAKFGQSSPNEVTLTRTTVTTGPIKLPEPMKLFSDNPGEPVTVVLASDRIGEGDPELGRELLKSFLLALDDMTKPPEALIFYNSAVHLATLDSPVLNILISLQRKHTEILVCSASLQHYRLVDQLEVGEIRTMAMLVERMMLAHHILWPK